MVNLSSWNTVKSFSGMSSAGGDSKEKVWRTITQEASIDIQGDFFFSSSSSLFFFEDINLVQVLPWK